MIRYACGFFYALFWPASRVPPESGFAPLSSLCGDAGGEPVSCKIMKGV